MKVKVKVEGLEKLYKKLEKLDDDSKAGVKKALIELALTDIETVAKMTLTERNHVVTGRLRASIHTEYTGDYIGEPAALTYKYSARKIMTDGNGKRIRNKRTGGIRFKGTQQFNGKLSQNPNKLQVFVGTNVVYARKIERLDAYLFPAFENAKPKIVMIIKKYITP